MKLIVGLGNPGRKYDDTRHNAGFMVLEELIENEGGGWGNEAKANALVSRIKIENEEVILALPQSYMNLSGEVVVDLLKWFKLSDSDLIVVHDELDLPLGEVQVRKNISAAGHNGIKSIIERIRSEDFIRVRIGIGSNESDIPSENYVLEKFSDTEKKEIEGAVKTAVEKIRLILKHGYSEFISKYNN